LRCVVLALEAIERDRSQKEPNDPGLPAFRSNVEQFRLTAHLQETLDESGEDTRMRDSSGDSRPTNLGLPVGIKNLRNTCYLNSILQYFFSVNAIRDFIVQSDAQNLEPTQVTVEQILGHIQEPEDLEPGRAFVGNQCKTKLF